MTRSRRLTQQERQEVLSHLFHEARNLIGEGMPLSEVDRQLRQYKRELLSLLRAGVQLTIIETQQPTTAIEHEKSDNTRKEM